MYIALEGVEGCGKTTVINILKRRLKERGKTFQVVKEPGTTKIGNKIREILLHDYENELDLNTELLLFMASRSSMIHQVIRPIQEEFILSDRCFLSSLAYQCNFDADLAQRIYRMHLELFEGNLPDKIFFIDIHPSKALCRKSQKDINKYEKKAMIFHEKVYHMYKEVLKEYSIAVDGNRRAVSIADDIARQIGL